MILKKMTHRDGSGASFFGRLCKVVKQWDGSGASFFGGLCKSVTQWDGSGVSFFGGLCKVVEQWDGSKPLKKSGKITVLVRIREMLAGWYYDLI